MLHLLQEAAQPAASSNTPTIASALTLLAVVAQGAWAHRKGTHGKRESTSSLDEIKTGIAKLGDEVKDLKAHVIGPDGENGLRGDVRELKTDVKGILERERAHPRNVGMYDRRGT